jgi:membrane protein DedA with SNARE-associated domain
MDAGIAAIVMGFAIVFLLGMTLGMRIQLHYEEKFYTARDHTQGGEGY